MAARDGDEMVIDAVGEADHADEADRADVPHAAGRRSGEAPPAEIEGVNMPADLLQSTLERAAPQGRDAVAAAVGRLGLQPASGRGASPRRRASTNRRWRWWPSSTMASASTCIRGC